MLPVPEGALQPSHLSVLPPRCVRARCCPVQEDTEPLPARPARPGPPGAAGRTPREGRAEPQHSTGREPSGSLPAPPRRSSPRYSGPGSESRSGLSILLLLPLLPGFRPFPRRPTLPAPLGRSPRLGTRPPPPPFRAHSRPPPVPSGAAAGLGLSPGKRTWSRLEAPGGAGCGEGHAPGGRESQQGLLESRNSERIRHL